MKAKEDLIEEEQVTRNVFPVETNQKKNPPRNNSQFYHAVERTLLTFVAVWVLTFVVFCADAFSPPAAWSSSITTRHRPSTTDRRSNSYSGTISTSTSTCTTHSSTTTQLQISSIRTWFSLVSSPPPSSSSSPGNNEVTKPKNEKKNQHTQQRTPSIFFRRNPKNNNSTNIGNSSNKMQSPLSQEDHDPTKLISLEGSSHTDHSSETAPPPPTWANLLGEETTTTTPVVPLVSAGDLTPSLSYGTSRRQAVQYGIFSPNSSLRQFPGYTSAWANTLSSTLHNTTSNAWNKVTHHSTKNSPVDDDDNDSSSSLDGRLLPPPPPLAIPSYLQPTDTLTVADLQAILQQQQQQQQPQTTSVQPLQPEVRAQDFAPSRSRSSGSSTSSFKRSLQDTLVPPGQSSAVPVTASAGSNHKPRKTKQGVAFPQVSVLDYKTLQRGTAVASAFTGMLLATTLLPNLWLMGMLAGAVYGNDICSRPEEPPPSNLLARTLIGWGRRLAQFTLQTMDSWRTLWFLYKTGELSYQYYKRYEVMDQRFAIQNKMDAWNAKFQEGKIKFDQWEQENEIGRTVLAGLRTVWLVDEQRKRRAKQTSRYRLVQSLYDTKYWMGRWTRKTWKALRASQWTDSVRDYVKGVQTDLFQSGRGSISARFGAVVASLIALNIVGALFAISPTFLALLAVVVGVAWPSWVSELAARLNSLTLETRARGRGEDTDNMMFGTSSTDSTIQQLLLSNKNNRAKTARLLGRYDKSKYHYFRREDGTKRYYRTGRSWFVGRRDKKNNNSANNNNKASTNNNNKSSPGSFSWPWAQPQRVRRTPEKEQWGLFLQNKSRN